MSRQDTEGSTIVECCPLAASADFRKWTLLSIRNSMYIMKRIGFKLFSVTGPTIGRA